MGEADGRPPLWCEADYADRIDALFRGPGYLQGIVLRPPLPLESP